MTVAPPSSAKTSIQLLLAVDAMIWAYLGYRILTFPENHWGVDNRWLIPFFGAQLVVALTLARRSPRTLSIAFVLVATLSVAGSIVLDSANVLLPYEVWLKRGMPERPF